MEESKEGVMKEVIVKKVVEEGGWELEMGVRELKGGRVWKRMGGESERGGMEGYLYLKVGEGKMIWEVMGEGEEEGVVWVAKEEGMM